jgi:MFS family permease
VGAKVAVAAGFVLLAAGLFLGSMMSVGSSGLFVGSWMAVAGLGTGIAMATAMSAALVELSEEKSGVGSAVLQAVNKTGGPFGIAVLGSVLSAGYLARLDLSGLPGGRRGRGVRQSVFGGVAVARRSTHRRCSLGARRPSCTAWTWHCSCPPASPWPAPSSPWSSCHHEEIMAPPQPGQPNDDEAAYNRRPPRPVASLARPHDGGPRWRQRAGCRPPASTGRRWWVLVVVCVSALIVNLDNTILNVALPTLVRKLHATSSQLQWIVDSYAMVFAGLLLVGGSLADRFGRKRFFLIGLAVFAGGIDRRRVLRLGGPADRLASGDGGRRGADDPLVAVDLNDVFRDPTEAGPAIGAWGGTIGLGIAIGPIAGGLLLANFWWGSVFLVNVPIVVAGFVAACCSCPTRRTPPPPGPIRSGRSCRSPGWACCCGRSSKPRPRAGLPAKVLGVGLASLVVLGAFVAWEARSHHPMLNLGFFSDRRFSVAAAAECLGTFGLLGALFLLTQFLQFDLGLSPLQAGVRILPMAAVLVVSARCPRCSGSRHRDQVHRCRRPGGDRRWLVADLGGVDAGTTTYGDVLPGLLLSVWAPGCCCRRRRTPWWDRSPRATPGSDQPPTPWPSRSAARSASP